MSMSFSIINCSKCHESWPSNKLWGKFTYELNNGLELDMDRTLGWCYSCKQVQAIEKIESIQGANDTLKSLESLYKEEQSKSIFWSIPYFNSSEMRYIKKKISAQKKRIEWLKKRVSKARCLTCFNTEVHALDFRAESNGNRAIGFEHPECGGQLHTRLSEFGLNLCLDEKFYNSEGELIRIES